MHREHICPPVCNDISNFVLQAILILGTCCQCGWVYVNLHPYSDDLVTFERTRFFRNAEYAAFWFNSTLYLGTTCLQRTSIQQLLVLQSYVTMGFFITEWIIYFNVLLKMEVSIKSSCDIKNSNTTQLSGSHSILFIVMHSLFWKIPCFQR